MACVRVTFRLCFVSKPSENSVYALITWFFWEGSVLRVEDRRRRIELL